MKVTNFQFYFKTLQKKTLESKKNRRITAQFHLKLLYYFECMPEALISFKYIVFTCPQAFSARSILDSTVSCDVTERYSPALSQTSLGQRGKRERLGTRLTAAIFMYKTMNRRPCLYTRKTLWELNCFHMLKLFFIPSNLQSC